MLSLAAPYPNTETITLLPSPEFNDADGNQASMNLMRSMSGVKRTYVKTTERRVTNYTIIMTRLKALELEAFVESYFGSQILLTDHRGQGYVGYISSNPLEINNDRRGLVIVTFQFEGTPL